MAPLGQAEIGSLSAQILQELSQTRYACSSLEQLSGGTTNFVFCGYFAQHRKAQDADQGINIKSVIIKHSTDFVAVNRDFPLVASRCIFEASMLNALTTLPTITTSDKVSLKAPHIYLFNRETNTQVIEDFPEATDLKAILVSPNANDILTQPLSTSIGRALGSWARSFHNWASDPAQAALRAKIANNAPMRKLKLRITYEAFIAVLENFPNILKESRKTLEEVKAMAAKEFEEPVSEGEEWGILHGDFWSGNVLLPTPVSLAAQQSEGLDLLIIDWEFSQFGHRAYDLGQMIGDLYERKHFNDVDGAMWAIEGFMDGYGALGEEMAFRTAVHVGVCLICWYIRRAPKGPLNASLERVEAAMKLGVEFIVKGWERDGKWFESSVLAPLFRKY